MVPVDKASPVGVFDSGLGGLTVVQKMAEYLPRESIIYFGDTANVPYGDKPASLLIWLADQIAGFLVGKGVKAVVDACNSTSSVALEFLKQKYDVPFVGVIEAGVKGALEATKNGNIGIIATKATIESGAHQRVVERLDPKVKLVGRACSSFVPLVESGLVNCPQAFEAAESYLMPLKEAGIDTLILGCTHYPFLSGVIREILGDSVLLVDPAANTVMELKNLLGNQINDGEPKTFSDHQYFVSGDPASFEEVGERLLGQSLGVVVQETLDMGGIQVSTQGGIL